VRARPLAGTLVAALGASVAAGAAEPAAARPGRFRVGPIYLTPRLELRNAGVDTNVFNSRTDEVADAALVLRPSVGAVMPVGRRLRLTGQGYFDLNYFQRQETERSNDFGGRGGAALRLGPLTLTGEGGGAQARQRFSIDVDERLLRQERWAGGGLRVDLTRRLSLTASGMTHVYEFAPSRDAEVKRSLDRDERSARGELRFALSGRTAFVAASEAIEDRFLSATTLEAPRLVRSYRHLAGFDFGPRALITGRVLAGYREFPRGGAPPYRGPVVAVSAALPLLRLARLTVLADRDVFYAVSRLQQSDERLRNTYVWTRLGGTVATALPLTIIARLGLGLEESRYLLPYVRQGVAVRRIDHLWTASASLLRPVGDGLRVGGTVAWTRRVSAIPELSYEGMRYGVQAEVVP
jgi:hypothetical protein